MKNSDLFLSWPLALIMGAFFLLTSCAPAATGLAPSGTLKNQLDEIREQQQQQTVAIQQLQQQLAQLKQQLGSEKIPLTQGQNYAEPMAQEKIPPAGEAAGLAPPTQFSVSQEVSTVAASASSYLAAFSNLAAGRWLAAETGFQEFLNDFGSHQYAPNARYWLANAQLSQGKTDLAMANLHQIIVDPNGQKKAPAALIQLAQIYRQQGSQTEADDALEQLRNHYPESQEAQQLYRSKEPIN